MSLKIHVSSTKTAEILEFLKINKPILRAGAKVKQKEEKGFYHVWLLTKD